MFEILMSGIAFIVSNIFSALFVLILISVLISWLNADPYNPYVQLVHKFTEPLYKPFRKLTRNISGPIDFAPMIVIFLLMFLQRVIPPMLMHIGRSF